jgi:hypothetical protein
MGVNVSSYASLLATVAITTVVWVSTTYLTAPASRETLVKFYRLVRPAGPGWRPIAGEAGVGGSPDKLSLSLLGWTLGCLFVYSGLFGTGSLLYGRMGPLVMWAVVFVASGIGLLLLVPKMWATEETTGVPALGELPSERRSQVPH